MPVVAPMPSTGIVSTGRPPRAAGASRNLALEAPGGQNPPDALSSARDPGSTPALRLHDRHQGTEQSTEAPCTRANESRRVRSPALRATSCESFHSNRYRNNRHP